MKILIVTAAVAALFATAASAQMAPAGEMAPPTPSIAAHKTGPSRAVATTTPTEMANGETAVSKTVSTGAPVSARRANMACTEQANQQHLHGTARAKMRTACIAAAKRAKSHNLRV